MFCFFFFACLPAGFLDRASCIHLYHFLRQHSVFQRLGVEKMSRPILVEIPGTSRDCATWVAEIEFHADHDLTFDKKDMFEAKLKEDKSYIGYHFGMWKFRPGGLAHLIVHLDTPKQNSSVKTTVERLLRVPGLGLRGVVKCVEAFRLPSLSHGLPWRRGQRRGETRRRG